MRLIDADAFNEKMKRTSRYFDVKFDIENMPTIDAVPVRHGRWECGKPCPVCGRGRFEGLDADIWADWEPPYCPNCGAKMEGGAE